MLAISIPDFTAHYLYYSSPTAKSLCIDVIIQRMRADLGQNLD